MASLKDIAQASGFSIRTVARVLHNSGYVGGQTRRLVMEVAQRLGYSPNLAARALKTGRSKEILAVPGSLDELLIEKIVAFEQALRAAGYWLHVVFDFVAEKQGLSDVVQDALALRAPAAVAFFPRYDMPMNKTIARLADESLPYVVVDGLFGKGEGVKIDRQQGVYDAVMHLAQSGRRRIAYLGSVAGKHARTRLDGYERAIKELGRKPILLPAELPVDEQGYEAGRVGAAMLLQMDVRPDAVQVHSDVMALGALSVFHENGIKVPDEIAVVGFDNRAMAGLSWPRLTTVAQPNQEAGQAAAEILLSCLDGTAHTTPSQPRILPTKLVLRDSA